MAQAFTPGLQLKERLLVRRRRDLPVPGEVLVQENQTVDAREIVARALLPGELHIIRLAEKLGLEPSEVAAGLRIKEGDEVNLSTLLCEYSGFFGLFKTRVLSPVAGQVELINNETGHVAIRAAPRPIELNAYVGGRIAALETRKSVTVETEAAFMQGIFGVGGERQGRIRLLEAAPGEQLRPEHIPDSAAGDILVGGSVPALEALRKAAAAGAVGFITGSIDDQALAGYLGYDLGIALTGDENIPMTVIITEGFGSLPISERVLALLKRHAGKRASINGATQVRAGAMRPEIIISLEQAGEVSTSVPEAAPGKGLEVGSLVRIIRVPFFGERGTVVALPQAMQKLATGAHARVLQARLEDGRLVSVPRANVELL